MKKILIIVFSISIVMSSNEYTPESSQKDPSLYLGDQNSSSPSSLSQTSGIDKLAESIMGLCAPEKTSIKEGDHSLNSLVQSNDLSSSNADIVKYVIDRFGSEEEFKKTMCRFIVNGSDVEQYKREGKIK